MSKRIVSLVTLALLLCLAPLAFSETTAFTYESGGRTVPAVYTAPDAATPETPLVVLCHGHGGSKDENVGFIAIADALAKAGIASIRMDYAGCGESAASFTENTLDNMIADTMAGLAEARKLHREGEYALGVLGYSMGGRIAATIVAAQDNPFDAMALLAGSVDPGEGLLERFFTSEGGWAAQYEIAKEKGYVDFTTVYGQEQKLSKEWFENLMASAPLSGNPFAGDVLLIEGTEDTVVQWEVYEAAAAQFETTASSLTKAEVKGANHGYGFYSDETAIRDQVVHAIVDFFSKAL